MRNFLKAVSILAFDSGSLLTVLDAAAAPVSMPSSPPTKKPAAEKNMPDRIWLKRELKLRVRD